MADVDWSVLELPDVKSVIEKAAERAYRQLDQIVERDDVLQEGYIIAARMPDKVRAFIAEGKLNFLFTEVYRDLQNCFGKAVRRAGRETPSGWDVPDESL